MQNVWIFFYIADLH